MKHRWVFVIAAGAIALGAVGGWYANSRVAEQDAYMTDGAWRIYEAGFCVKVLREIDGERPEIAQRLLRGRLEHEIDALYHRPDEQLEFSIYSSQYASKVEESADYLDEYHDRLAAWARHLAARIDDERKAS